MPRSALQTAGDINFLRALRKTNLAAGFDNDSFSTVSRDATAVRLSILKAEAALRRLDANTDAVAKKLAEAGTAYGRLKSGVASLAQRAKESGFGLTRTGIKAGVLRLSETGLRIGRGAFILGAVGNAVGRGMNLAADLRDEIDGIYKHGGNGGNVAQAALAATGAGALGTVTKVTGLESITKGLARLVTGEREEAIDHGTAKLGQQINEAISSWFGLQRNVLKERRETAIAEATYQAAEKIRNEMADEAAAIHQYRPRTFRYRNAAAAAVYHKRMDEINSGLIEQKKNRRIQDAHDKIVHAMLGGGG